MAYQSFDPGGYLPSPYSLSMMGSLSAPITPNQLRSTNRRNVPQFKKGDRVVIVSESHGWGRVSRGMKGTVNGPATRYNSILPSGSAALSINVAGIEDDWICEPRDLQLDGPVEKKPEPEKKVSKVSLSSIVIAPAKMEAIKAAISQLDYTDLIFNKWGFGDVFEKGTAVSLLFYGVPGTGKTLMGQGIADHLNQKLLVVGPAEIETSTPGGAERNIKRFFKIASGKLGAPTDAVDDKGQPVLGKPQKHVLLFDECDSLITNRDNVGVIMRGQINTLLSELEQYNGIVIFTTNSIKSLDPAMERRITSKIEFEFPNLEARKKIWKRMIPKKAPIAKDVDFDQLAQFQFAGGNIKNIVLNAARQAAFDGKKEIGHDYFVSAMEQEAVGMKAFEATYLESNGRPARKLGNDVTAEVGKGGIQLIKQKITEGK